MTEANVSAVITTPMTSETMLETIMRVAHKINETAQHGQDDPAAEAVRFIRISVADLDDLRLAFERHDKQVSEVVQFYAHGSSVALDELPCTCGLPASDPRHAEQHQRVLADDAARFDRESTIADLDARAAALDQANP